RDGNTDMIATLLIVIAITRSTLAAEGLHSSEQENEIAGIDLCTLRCKDNHMSKNMDNEWSSAFTLPILNLLRRTGNISAAHAKVHQICMEDLAFDDCLSRCNNTMEAEIIRLGLNSFADACESTKLESQLGCWKAHTNDIETGCLEYTTRLRRKMEMLSVNQSMTIVGDVCSEYVRFSGCLEQQFDNNCGYVSRSVEWTFLDIVSEDFVKLTRRMSERSRRSIFRMLSLKFKTLPLACSPSSTYRRDVTTDYLTGTGLFFSSPSRASVFHISSIVLALKLA
ncbi:hypothetical protein PMAYCL1PPCAC_04456, partial [Pristionchus mayeri]